METSTGGYIETKRVFIATDDPTVFAECRRKYPQFTFLGNETSAQIASDREKSRLSKEGLLGIIQVRSMLLQFSSPYFFAITFFRDFTAAFLHVSRNTGIDHKGKSEDSEWHAHTLNGVY